MKKEWTGLFVREVPRQGSIHTAIVHAHDSSHLNSERNWPMEHQAMKMYRLLRKKASSALQKRQVLRKKKSAVVLKEISIELLYRV